MAKLVSATYGEALFTSAQENGTTDTMLEEVIQVQKILKDNSDFSILMNHPKVSEEESKNILREVFSGRISEELLNFLLLILQKDRYKDISDIFDYFVGRVKEFEGIGVATVITAVPLSDIQKKEIEAKLLQTTSYRRFEMTYDVDAALIGGMQIRIKDRVVDSSIKTKLEGMERELLKIQLG